MYSQCAQDSNDRIDVVRRILDANDGLREILFGNLPISNDPAIQYLRSRYPGDTNWKIFEHCAVITRLYAILEQCIGDLARTWLEDLPNMVPSYASLEATFAETHREGMAWILRNISQGRYKHLSAPEICRDYADAISGTDGFRVLPEAFLAENLTWKMERISKLLTSLRIENALTWLQGHGAIKAYLENTRGGQTTCEAELREFISYRNDAAHGTVDQVLGLGSLFDFTMFIEVLCTALCEQFGWNRVRLLKEHKALQPIGVVTEVFKQSRAVVAKVSRAVFTAGDTLVLVGPRTYRESRIVSIQNQSRTLLSIAATSGMELGLQFDWLPSKGCELFSLQLSTDP